MQFSFWCEIHVHSTYKGSNLSVVWYAETYVCHEYDSFYEMRRVQNKPEDTGINIEFLVVLSSVCPYTT